MIELALPKVWTESGIGITKGKIQSKSWWHNPGAQRLRQELGWVEVANLIQTNVTPAEEGVPAGETDYHICLWSVFLIAN